MVMYPPCHPGNMSSLSLAPPASSPSAPSLNLSSSTPASQLNHQTLQSSSWTPSQPLDQYHRLVNILDGSHSCHVPAQAHLAEAEIPGGNTEIHDNDSLHEEPPPSDTTPSNFAALGVAPSVSSPTFHNTDYFFDAYHMHELSPMSFMVIPPGHVDPISSPLYDFIQTEGPIAFATFQQCYNSILDSGCTNHIFHDHSVFWSYDPEHAVSLTVVHCAH